MYNKIKTMKKWIFFFLLTTLICLATNILYGQSNIEPGYGDKDNDGVLDKDDECPDLVGSKSNKGCPVKNQNTQLISSSKSFGFIYKANNKDSVTVEFIFEKSPAIESGFQVGDLIISVNDVNIFNKPKEEIRTIFSNLPDDNVKFVIKRNNTTKELNASKAEKNLMLDVCLTGNCQNGKGTFQDSTGAKYDGDFKNGLKNGNGKMQYRNENIYTGNWVQNKRNGLGNIITKKGDQYIGNWNDDDFEGNGEYKWSNGQIYNGGWVKSKRSGKGKQIFENKCSYEGQWLNDEIYGYGKYTFPSGDTYTGEFKNSKYNGKGVINYSDGDKYEGDFIDNIRNGKGLYVFANGITYNGSFKDGKYDGYGEMEFANGTTKKGNWIAGIFQENLVAKQNDRLSFDGNTATNENKKKVEKENDERTVITMEDFNADVKKVNANTTAKLEKIKNNITTKSINDFTLEELNAARKAVTPEYRKILEESKKSNKEAAEEADYYIAYMYLDEKKYTEALNSFNVAIEKHPAFARNYFGRSFVYSMQDKNELALKDLDKAIELNKTADAPYYSRAKMKAKMKEYKAAMNDINTAINLNPKDGDYKSLKFYIKTELDKVENVARTTITNVFTETFSNNKNSWGITEPNIQGKTNIQLKDGTYIISAYGGVNTSIKAKPCDKTKGYDVAIDGRRPEQDTNGSNAFGLVFGAKDNDNYYAFIVAVSTSATHPNKEFFIGKMIDGKFMVFDKGKLDINSGTNNNYNLKIEYTTMEWNFYVNNTKVFRYNSSNIPAANLGDGVGMIVNGENYTVAFDNLMINN